MTNLTKAIAEQRQTKAAECMRHAQAHGLSTPHGQRYEREGFYWLFALRFAQSGDTRAFLPPDRLVIVRDGDDSAPDCEPCQWVDFLVENNGTHGDKAVSGGALSDHEIVTIMGTLQRGETYRANEGAGGLWSIRLAPSTPGQTAYEAECEESPLYHDGTPRAAWATLSPIARLSWERNPTPRRVRRVPTI